MRNLLPRAARLPQRTRRQPDELHAETTGWEITELHWCCQDTRPDFAPFGYRLRQVPTGLLDEVKDRPEMTIIAEFSSE